MSSTEFIGLPPQASVRLAHSEGREKEREREREREREKERER
jgi:hypothetical protein